MHTLMWTHKRFSYGSNFEWIENVIHADNRWTLYCLYLTLQESSQAKAGDLGPFSCIVFGKYYSDVTALNESPRFLGINSCGVVH